MGTTSATGGVAIWPRPGDPPLSTTGSASTGALRHYQVWYRNAMPFCMPVTFNLSEGLSIAWVF
jgi:hypothetical protein